MHKMHPLEYLTGSLPAKPGDEIDSVGDSETGVLSRIKDFFEGGAKCELFSKETLGPDSYRVPGHPCHGGYTFANTEDMDQSLQSTNYGESKVSDTPTFTGLQAATVQTALRSALGLQPEVFPVQAFIGMISDEIEQLRACGRDDGDIASLVSEASGADVSSDMIGRFYAPPEERRHN